MSASALNRRSRLEFRSWRFVVAGFVLALLVCGIEGSPVFAHENPPVDHSVDDHVHWDGTVEVRPASLTLTKGKSVTYELRLTEPPENHGVLEDGWWVMIRVDVEYEGISWVPSVGWEFTKDNWE